MPCLDSTPNLNLLSFLYSHIDFSLLHSSTHIWGHEFLAFKFLEDQITFGNRWDPGYLGFQQNISWEGRHFFRVVTRST